MKGAEAVLECLRAEGIKYVFGNPGSTEIPFLDALSGAGDISYVMALQEGIAVGMADGYARSGGKLGFVNVHSAAGTANALGGIYNAWYDRSPVVVTAGYKDTRILGRECFLEVPDLPGIPRQFVKWSWQVMQAGNIGEDLLRGIKMAATPPCGPVFLALPEDLLHGETAAGEIVSQRPKTSLAFCGDAESIKKAASLLAAARTPLLVVGADTARSEAIEEAVTLAEMLALPVMTDCRDALSTFNFSHSHASFRGSFEASYLSEKKTDVILGLGCKMFVESAYDPKRDIPSTIKIIHFHSDSHELARLYPEEVSVLTDAKKGIRSLIEALKPLITEEVERAIAGRRQVLALEKEEEDRNKREEIQSSWDETPIQLPRLVCELQESLPRDAIVVDEAVRSSRALLRYYDFDAPGTYYRSAGGALGWGTPAALGVKLANPGRQVAAFVGDGSILYSIQSLWTAARYNIPVLIVVCNNRQYKAVQDAAMRYDGVAARKGHVVAADISSPDIDFCRVARGFGVWAKKVTDPQAIKDSLSEALALKKPALLDVAIDRHARLKVGL